MYQMKKTYLTILALSASLFLMQCKKDEETPSTSASTTTGANYAPNNSILLDSLQLPITNVVAQPVFEDYYIEGSFLFQQATSVLLGNVSLYFDSTSVAPADGVYSLGRNTNQQSNIVFSQMNGGNPQSYVVQTGKLNVDIVGGKKRYRVTDALFKQASGVAERKASFTMVEN
jgi:hypothetical protein